MMAGWRVSDRCLTLIKSPIMAQLLSLEYGPTGSPADAVVEQNRMRLIAGNLLARSGPVCTRPDGPNAQDNDGDIDRQPDQQDGNGNLHLNQTPRS
jgi:hypothetical protein